MSIWTTKLWYRDLTKIGKSRLNNGNNLITEEKNWEKKVTDYQDKVIKGKKIVLIPPPKRTKSSTIVDRKKFDEELELKTSIKKNFGDLAERAVRDYEKAVLNKEGYPDLAEKVHILDTHGTGYDIQSYYSDGKAKNIEVKFVGQNKDHFYISKNEYNELLNGNTTIFIVRSSKENKFVIHELDTSNNEKLIFDPVVYAGYFD